MSAGSIAATLNPNAPRPYKRGRSFIQYLVLALTDSYVTDGVTVNLAGLDTPGLSAPFAWRIYPADGSSDSYFYEPGTDRSNGQVLAYAGATQHTSDTAWADATVLAEFEYPVS